MTARTVGESALVGWRARVGDTLARGLARRTALEPEQVRTAVGIGFLLISVWYVGSTPGRIARQR
jgi:hypothetical protein